MQKLQAVEFNHFFLRIWNYFIGQKTPCTVLKQGNFWGIFSEHLYNYIGIVYI